MLESFPLLMGSVRDNPGPLLCVVGARPNYIKMAPLLRAFGAVAALPPAVLVHTGQHYDPMLNDRLFDDLALPRPDITLQVGSGSHACKQPR
jgi:UDP-N-acetylglucosamine 2-epimerase (non-hydrolysing)